MIATGFLPITDQVAGHLRAEILRGRWRKADRRHQPDESMAA
jgi:hypothetical protein